MIFLLLSLIAYSCAVDSSTAVYAKEDIFFKLDDNSALVKRGVPLETRSDESNPLIKTRLWVDREGNLLIDKDTDFIVGSLLENNPDFTDRYVYLQKKVGKEFVVQSQTEALESLDDLYVERCGTCHRLYEPYMYNTEYWNQIMGSMKIQAGISDEEYKDITYYLHISSYNPND